MLAIANCALTEEFLAPRAARKTVSGYAGRYPAGALALHA